MTPDEALRPEDRLVGLARVAGAGLIWGTIPIIIRLADGASAITVFFRMFCAGAVIGGMMLATGSWRELTMLSRAKLLQVAGQGLILTLNWFLFLTALDMTNVATAELLAYCGPVWVAALAPFVTRERFDPRILLPLGLALGGIVVILAPQGIGVSSPRELLGAGMAFASSLTYATLLLRSKKILRGISSGSLMVIEYGVASLVLAPFVAAAYLRGDTPSSPQAYVALITLGVVHTAVAGYLFLGGLRRVRTDHAAILTYVEPASAVVFASLFLGEKLTIPTVVGGVLVIAGGVLVARIETRERVEPGPIEAPSDESYQAPPSQPDDSGGYTPYT